MHLSQTIFVCLDGHRCELRPTLRAAMHLERAHGLETLGRKLSELSVTAIADTIAATVSPPCTANAVTTLILARGIADTVLHLVPALVELVGGLAGIDPDAEESPANPDADRTTIAQAQRELFRIGTGKLGWSPAATFDATPLEIIEAWKGRIELLKDIFGGSDQAKPKRAGSVDDKFARLQASIASHWAEEPA